MRAWRPVLALAALLAPLLVPGYAGAEPAIWRLGFYWSPTADSYPPAAVPWSLYTHVTQMGIRPTADCDIDEKWYAVDQVKFDLVRVGRKRGVPVLITLIQDEPMTAMRACTSPGRIAAFTARVVDYVRNNGYDGLDLDWEGNVDPRQYQELVNRLRLAMPTAILTADIAVHQRGYLVPVQDRLDRINLMNYDLWTSDYNGKLLHETWHHAPLRAAGDRERHQSAEAAVDYLIESGIRPEKVNLGVPFYGYVFRGCRDGGKPGKSCEQLSGPREPIGPAGMTRVQINFNQVMALYGAGDLKWDDTRQTPWISFRRSRTPGCDSGPCAGDAFVTYTNERQMMEAVRFLRRRQLGGIMTFALHQEYMASASGAARYPLSTAIATAFGEPEGR